MDNFFEIQDKRVAEDGRYRYVVLINQKHPVFQGHFPGDPIVPGVMTMMTVRMCAEDAAHLAPTRYASVKEAKYFRPIRPDGKPIVITFSIDESLTVKADVCSESGEDMTKVNGKLLAVSPD